MHAHDVLEEVANATEGLRALIPDVYTGYAAISAAVSTDGALSRKTKELIALAVAATVKCDGFIASHARNAARAGASSQEVAEAMSVVILMNGGQGTVWGARPRRLRGDGPTRLT